MNTYSPIRESSREGSSAAGVYYEYGAVSPSWCGCFRLCGFGSGAGDGGDGRYLIGGEDNGRESWVAGKFKKIKEFSEVVAGPKWKNMVRKIGKYCNPRKGKTAAFQYDAESYALNFADGRPEEEEDDGLLRNFSSRFAAPGQRMGGL